MLKYILGSFLLAAAVFNASRIGHFEGIFLHPGVVPGTGGVAVIARGGTLLTGSVGSPILISDKIAVVRFLFSFVLALLRGSYHLLLFLIVVLEIGVGHDNYLCGLVQDQSIVEHLTNGVISSRLTFLHHFGRLPFG